METKTLFITDKEKRITTIEDVSYHMYTGNFLIVTCKDTQTNDTGDNFLLTTDKIFNLNDLDNITLRHITKKYDTK